MKRAIVIEDEKAIQEILEELLKNECGFDEVHFADDGLDGYLKLMTNTYDLICLDQMMPHCNGTDVLVAIRKKDGPNKVSPVLFISAYIPQIPEELKKADYTFFLEKPVEVSRFVRYVKMSMNKSA